MYERLVAECHKSSELLQSSCSPAAFIRVQKQLGELDQALDDIRLNLTNNNAEQELETYHVDNYDNLLQVGNVVAGTACYLALLVLIMSCYVLSFAVFFGPGSSCIVASVGIIVSSQGGICGLKQ